MDFLSFAACEAPFVPIVRSGRRGTSRWPGPVRLPVVFPVFAPHVELGDTPAMPIDRRPSVIPLHDAVVFEFNPNEFDIFNTAAPPKFYHIKIRKIFPKFQYSADKFVALSDSFLSKYVSNRVSNQYQYCYFFLFERGTQCNNFKAFSNAFKKNPNKTYSLPCLVTIHVFVCFKFKNSFDFI